MEFSYWSQILWAMKDSAHTIRWYRIFTWRYYDKDIEFLYDFWYLEKHDEKHSLYFCLLFYNQLQMYSLSKPIIRCQSGNLTRKCVKRNFKNTKKAGLPLKALPKASFVMEVEQTVLFRVFPRLNFFVNRMF